MNINNDFVISRSVVLKYIVVKSIDINVPQLYCPYKVHSGAERASRLYLESKNQLSAIFFSFTKDQVDQRYCELYRYSCI